MTRKAFVRRRLLENHGRTKGGKQPPEYQIWAQIKQRCYNENHPKYENFGGRGILMDARWRKSFSAFLEDVKPRPDRKHQIYRIDQKKGYFPGNVRWATKKEQARNVSTNRIVDYKGEKKVLAQLAEETGRDRKRLQDRLESGFGVVEAVERPVERGHLYFKFNSEEHNLGVWAKKLRIPYQTLHHRIVKKGWPVERAFTMPHRERRKKNGRAETERK